MPKRRTTTASAADTLGAEGARQRPRDKAADTLDVEGARQRPRDKAADTLGAEGARQRPRVVDDKDVDGHSFLIDPHSARQVSRDRSAEVERQARERARQKEARPNKQHQD